jgi:hypothetical protein
MCRAVPPWRARRLEPSSSLPHTLTWAQAFGSDLRITSVSEEGMLICEYAALADP